MISRVFTHEMYVISKRKSTIQFLVLTVVDQNDYCIEIKPLQSAYMSAYLIYSEFVF